MLRLALLILLAGLLLTRPALAASSRADLDAQFQKWLAGEMWPAAKAAGVSRATFDTAFAGVTLDFGLPELTTSPKDVEHQAEFRSPGAYFREAGITALAAAGQARLKKWERTLAAIEKRYGVPRGIIVAIWGRESAFGETPLPHAAIRALATGAFIGRRPGLFRGELIAALEILQAGDVTPGRMRSSWAGAMGQPQMLPSHFLKFAVDFDGDGKRDIWSSVPDSLASIAHSLREEGWKPERGWGLEASVPASVTCTLEGPEQGKPMAEWARLGVTRVGGAPLPAGRREAFLLMPAGRLGPAFIVTENFYTLKSYNNSDLYALFIAHLADRFAGGDAFSGQWQSLAGFSRGDVARIQKKLEGGGHDVGGSDGLVGFKTRIAVGKWQAKMKRAVTCYPDAAMVKALQ